MTKNTDSLRGSWADALIYAAPGLTVSKCIEDQMKSFGLAFAEGRLTQLADALFKRYQSHEILRVMKGLGLEGCSNALRIRGLTNRRLMRSLEDIFEQTSAINEQMDALTTSLITQFDDLTDQFGVVRPDILVKCYGPSLYFGFAFIGGLLDNLLSTVNSDFSRNLDYGTFTYPGAALKAAYRAQQHTKES